MTISHCPTYIEHLLVPEENRFTKLLHFNMEEKTSRPESKEIVSRPASKGKLPPPPTAPLVDARITGALTRKKKQEQRQKEAEEGGLKIGDPAYWEVRYKVEIEDRIGEYDLFDWYCSFADLYPMLRPYFEASIYQKILILGVGRSDVIEHLYRIGYRDITVIDISQSIINEMQRRFEKFTGVEFFVMDVKQLHKFSNETFTMVFDKACIDAQFGATDYLEAAGQAFREIFRVLRQDGIFLMVTHAPPIARVPYLRLINWALEMYKIPSTIGEGLSLYVITKTDNPAMLAKKVNGGESAVRKKTSRIVAADADAKAQKASSSKSGQNSGMLTVSASIDMLANLVAESAEVDS